MSDEYSFIIYFELEYDVSEGFGKYLELHKKEFTELKKQWTLQAELLLRSLHYSYQVRN